MLIDCVATVSVVFRRSVRCDNGGGHDCCYAYRGAEGRVRWIISLKQAVGTAGKARRLEAEVMVALRTLGRRVRE